jgi:flagella basal body P-ring formation protein FlgA
MKPGWVGLMRRACGSWLALLACAAAHAQGGNVPAAAGAVAAVPVHAAAGEPWGDVDLTHAVQRVLQEVAQRLAAEHGLEQVSVQPLAGRVVLGLPPGAVDVQERRSTGAAWRTRFSQWLEVRVDGRLRRTLAVPVAASAQRRVLQAARPIAAGEWIDPRNTVAVLLDAATAAGALAASDWQPLRHRALQPVAAGAPVMLGALQDEQVAARGTVVPVLFRSAAVEVQTLGTLVQQAREGEAVRVRVPRLHTEVMARRVDGRYLVIEDQPGAAR